MFCAQEVRKKGAGFQVRFQNDAATLIASHVISCPQGPFGVDLLQRWRRYNREGVVERIDGA